MAFTSSRFKPKNSLNKVATSHTTL